MRHRSLKSAAAAVVALTTAAALAACGSSAAADQKDAGSAASANPDKIVISHIPGEEQTTLSPSEKMVAQILTDKLGIPVEYVTATSYAATIEAQRAKKAAIAGYGPFSYVLAKDSGVGTDLIGIAVQGKDDPTGYYSVASVRADSDIKTLADAKGKNVCFVDPASTSGYLFPTAGLLKVGINPDKGGVHEIFAGGHDASVLALVDGQCDLAFSTEEMATQQLIESGQVKKGAIKQIWKSELIPSSPVTVSTYLPPALQKKIKDVYLNDLNVDALKKAGKCDTSAKDGFCGLGFWGYRPVKDSDYDGVRAVCDETKAQTCTAMS